MSRQNQRHESSRHMATERSQHPLLPKSSQSPPAPEPQRKPGHRRPNAAYPPTLPMQSLRTGMQGTVLPGGNAVSESQMRLASTGTVAPRATNRLAAAPGYVDTQFPEDNRDGTAAAMNSVERASSLVVEPHAGHVSGSESAAHQQMSMPMPHTIPQFPQGNQVPIGMDLTQPVLAPHWVPPESYVAGTTIKQADILRDLDRRVRVLEKVNKPDDSARQKRRKRK